MGRNEFCRESDDWEDYALETEELQSHIASICDMTEAGKVYWSLRSYEYPRFFVHNPFAHDLEADISHSFLVEGRAQGRIFMYSIREAVNLPSGLCDIEIKEQTPDTEYSSCLSFDHDYEYLTSQRAALERYETHPFIRFSNLVIEQIKQANFLKAVPEAKKDQAFSFEPVPAEFAHLPILQQARKTYERCDAVAFHGLVLSNDLRDGLELKDT